MNNSTINLILNILIVIVFVAIVFLSMSSTRDIESFFDNKQIFFSIGGVETTCPEVLCDRISIPKYDKGASRGGFKLGIGPLPYGYIQIPKGEGLLASKDIRKDATQTYRFLNQEDNGILNTN